MFKKEIIILVLKSVVSFLVLMKEALGKFFPKTTCRIRVFVIAFSANSHYHQASHERNGYG
jgi:hypothetical protein